MRATSGSWTSSCWGRGPARRRRRPPPSSSPSPGSADAVSPLLRRAIPLMDGRAESIYEGPAADPPSSSCGVAGRASVRRTRCVRRRRRTGGPPDRRHESARLSMTAADHLARRRQRRDLRRAGRISDAGFERRGYTDGGRAVRRDRDPARRRSSVRTAARSPRGSRPGTPCCAIRCSRRRAAIGCCVGWALDVENAEQVPRRGPDAADLFRVFRPRHARPGSGSQAITSWIIASQSGHSWAPGRRSSVTSTPAAGRLVGEPLGAGEQRVLGAAPQIERRYAGRLPQQGEDVLVVGERPTEDPLGEVGPLRLEQDQPAGRAPRRATRPPRSARDG